MALGIPAAPLPIQLLTNSLGKASWPEGLGPSHSQGRVGGSSQLLDQATAAMQGVNQQMEALLLHLSLSAIEFLTK